jgi:hypothetical protein
MSLLIKANVGVVYYFGRRYDDAIQELSKIVEEKPDFRIARWGLGWSMSRRACTVEPLLSSKRLEGSNTAAPTQFRRLGMFTL